MQFVPVAGSTNLLAEKTSKRPTCPKISENRAEDQPVTNEIYHPDILGSQQTLMMLMWK